MYSTCLFCNRDLGANEVLETLPIGRRLAFDPSQGRLWVICPHCVRWNLVPFDTRLESIDAAERLFRDTRMRFSTDNIGLARLRDGLELVRIGPALRPEFAAWRYGDRFASRRRRNIAVGVGAGVVIVGVAAGMSALMGGAAGGMWGSWGTMLQTFRKRRISTRFALRDGTVPVNLTRMDVEQSRFLVGAEELEGVAGEWGLQIPIRPVVAGRWCDGKRPADSMIVTGPEALVALAQMLPAVAGTSGNRTQVSRAVGLVEQVPSVDAMLSTRSFQYKGKILDAGKIRSLAAEPRLAIEMLANEESERRWLEGELKLLERQWRDAERLAAIADKLALPAEVEEEFRRRQ